MTNTTNPLIVHLDILIDVLSILLNNEIVFSINAVDDNAQTVHIKTDIDRKLEEQIEALDNIDLLISDYHFYGYSSDGDVQPLDRSDERTNKPLK